MDVETGVVLAGRYELGEVLGGGAMSEVRTARDRHLERTVAVKILTSAASAIATSQARFQIEAQVAASLAHPNVVATYDYGVDRSVLFLVMECLPGTTLADECARDVQLSIARVRQVALEVLAGLGVAHERGVLHRDIKPANVLLTVDQHAKISDFGIATSAGLSSLTSTGMVLGTPSYLAPERLEGEPATVQSDVYSVGVLCYEALAGVRPFAGDTPIAIAYAARHTQPVPLRRHRADVPAALERAVMRAMARPPAVRFESAAAFAAALEKDAVINDTITSPVPAPTLAGTDIARTRVLPTRLQQNRARRGRRRAGSLVAAIVVAIAITIGGAFALYQANSSPARPSQSPIATPTTAPLPPSLRGPFATLQQTVQR